MQMMLLSQRDLKHLEEACQPGVWRGDWNRETWQRGTRSNKGVTALL